MSAAAKPCAVCAPTPKGMACDRARVSPAGLVHLVDRRGRTFCGKTSGEGWRRP